ncbi:DUF3050 domain-containing protein [Flavobacteriaceae bacterium]|nr:DUF3050 domain-containing protein [Flavobacteriaceae bacterium]MDA9037660.1 DUF3050 domain-containing protein [Flavobacteriaceae bacterium]MDC0386687.1 DUF3050 domain-containing protein [Flavobacteriaceae bacterium]
MMIERLEEELLPLRVQLQNHPVYKSIDTLEDIQCFMEAHVFAVWDFMSLLKQLQNLLSCNTVPWRPSGYPKASRLINEIVWGEESDINRNGVPMSHFEMYIEAMHSLNADTDQIDRLITKLSSGSTIFEILEHAPYPAHIKNFLQFTFEVVNSEKPHIIAAVFTFGREDLIPDMFVEIIKNLNTPDGIDLSDLTYYFERHIEVDSGEHGPMALEMIKQLCGEDTDYWEEALHYSKQALRLRIELWDGILASLENKTSIVSLK